ncbi:uncharacterized protein LOC126847001 isoform X2 [Adelges cooleyi]|uniref:uncharacterized protein LOC126847001 isoform X2 n=1 Tax=Adelges cooleyi TaxID=133065 RepID=UPI00217F8957|nr:uncharacterized protein LOC126847001 isoform X2 [Adelges cooleyi]
MSIEDNESVDEYFTSLRSDLMNREDITRMERPSRIFSSRHHSYPLSPMYSDNNNMDLSDQLRYRSRELARNLGSPLRSTQPEGGSDLRYVGDYERRPRPYPWRYSDRSYNSSPTIPNTSNGDTGRNRSPYVRFTITDPDTQRVTAAGQIPLNDPSNTHTARSETPPEGSLELENMLHAYSNNFLANQSVLNSFNNPMASRNPASGRRSRRLMDHPYFMRHHVDTPIRPPNRRVRFSSTNQNYSDHSFDDRTPEQELPAEQEEQIELENISYDVMNHSQGSVSSLSSISMPDVDSSDERRLQDFTVSENNESSNGDLENRRSNMLITIQSLDPGNNEPISPFSVQSENSPPVTLSPPLLTISNNMNSRSLSYTDNDEEDDHASISMELEPAHNSNIALNRFVVDDLNDTDGSQDGIEENLSPQNRPATAEQINNECEVTEESVSHAQVEEHPGTYKELNEQLVRLFECPVCFEHIIPPIYQCCMGHIICQTCKQKCEICPTCRNSFNSERNLYMEKVGYLLKYPCKNSLTGCTEQMFMEQKERHEQECGYQHYPCFLSNCSWKGYYAEFHVHMTQNHSSIILSGEEQTLDIIVQGNNSQTNKWFLCAHGEHFVIIVNMSGPPNQIKAHVNYIGHASKAKMFNFSITLSKNQNDNMSQKLTYTRPTLPYSEIRISNSHNRQNDIFCLPGEVIEPYVNKRSNRLPIILKIESM